MEKRYGALRFIATVYKILGVILGVIVILAAIGICATMILGGAGAANQFDRSFGAGGLIGGAVVGIVVSLMIIIVYGGLAVTLYAMGEGISLLIALEENTRATVQMLGQRAQQNLPGI